MTSPAQFDPKKPPQEHFAAYADGELRGEALIRVEEWLCAHPEDAALVEAQQQPATLCRRSAPPEPIEEKWSAVLEKIEFALTSPAAADPLPLSRQREAKRRVSIRIAVAMWATAAAAIVALVLYLQKPQPIALNRSADNSSTMVQELQAPDSEIPDESLAFLQDPAIAMLILSPEDVDIVSLEGDDDSALVVGAPPVGKTLPLAAPGDVVLVSVAADDDGMVPEMRTPQGLAGVPMIVTPMIGSNIDRKKP
jgi:hypothetical protein